MTAWELFAEATLICAAFVKKRRILWRAKSAFDLEGSPLGPTVGRPIGSLTVEPER